MLPQDIAKAYHKLIVLLKQNLSAKATASQAASGSKDPSSVVAMTLDLLALLLPYLPSSEASALFESCLSKELLESKDNAVQKRAYKILAKLMEAGQVSIDAQSVLQQLDGFLDGLSPAAKKVCFNLAYPLRTSHNNSFRIVSLFSVNLSRKSRQPTCISSLRLYLRQFWELRNHPKKRGLLHSILSSPWAVK